MVSKMVSRKTHFELHLNNSIALSHCTLTLKSINRLSSIMTKYEKSLSNVYKAKD
jgi:hypothetical protein